MAGLGRGRGKTHILAPVSECQKLLQAVLNNAKPLEKQVAELGGFIKAGGGSAELGNMFFKLADYYVKYQNSYVKHDDAVIEEEVEFVFEITSSSMKRIVRISRLTSP